MKKILLSNKDVCQRNTCIDVFRALALLTIFINHIPGTIYEDFTHKNFGFSDSAEAFVFISGIAVGLSYGTRFNGRNRLILTIKMWRRTWVLYSAHIMMTFVTLAIFCGSAIFMDNPELLSEINIRPVIQDPEKALFGIVTLGHQLGYNNILPLYMILMFLAPLILYVAGAKRRLLVFISGFIYFFSGWFQIAPHNYPTEGVWFLNPLSWQFLFVLGVVSTVHVKRGGQIPNHPFLIVGAVSYLLVSLVWVRYNLWWINISLNMPDTLIGFNKTYISLPRLLHILAIVYVLTAIPAFSFLVRLRKWNPLVILGKHSLPVFISGTILSLIAQIIKKLTPASIFYDTLLILLGIFVQFALAYYLEWVTVLKQRTEML
ncbi:MAG: OpgC protein [Candidatus Tokpelaia sp. JSC161]|nr:MAG: OpgC protein [Candidatus Tokpelaia sp. JSC161]